MRDLTVTEDITLDGVIEATEGWFDPAGGSCVDRDLDRPLGAAVAEGAPRARRSNVRGRSVVVVAGRGCVEEQRIISERTEPRGGT